MKTYIERLKKLGYKTHEAVRIYQFFVLYFDVDLLRCFIERLERDDYVEKV